MQRPSTTSDRTAGRLVRASRLMLLLLVVAFALTTIPGVRPEPGFSTLFDGWLQGSAYVACAVVALLVPLRTRHERAEWLLLGAAIALRALGFVLWLAYVRHLDPLPYPSVSDLVWLAMSVVLLVVLALRTRAVIPRMSTPLFLDALAAALLVSGFALELVYALLVDLNPEGTPRAAVATNLAYPMFDVAFFVLVVGVLTAWRWRPPLRDLALYVGVVGFAVGDVVFLYQISAGAYRPGSWLATLSLAVTALMSVASGLPRRDRVVPPASTAPPNIVFPASLAFVSLGFFVYSAFTRLPLESLLLVAGAMSVVVLRGITTLVADRAEASATIGEKSDELLRFQAMVEASSDFIAIAGMDGRVSYVNPAGRELVGLGPDVDVRTTTIADYLTEEGLRASLEIEQPAVVEHGHWEGESTLRDMRGGPPVPVAIASFLMFHPRTGEPFALATVQRDITERLAARRALEELAHQRQTLLSRLVQAQEDERARIAADVHDDSVQALAAVDLRLGLVRRQLAAQGSDLVENVDKALQTVGGATARLRHLLFDLESPAQETDLASALTSAAEFVFEDTGIAWEVTGDVDVDLPAAARVTAYRIAKEAMVNVRRHARATRAEIGLARGDDGVLVTVADDGRGLDPSQVRHRPGHRGLASIRDRATIAGGWLRIEGAPGEGTRVFLWLPDVAPTNGDEDETGG